MTPSSLKPCKGITNVADLHVESKGLKMIDKRTNLTKKTIEIIEREEISRDRIIAMS